MLDQTSPSWVPTDIPNIHGVSHGAAFSNIRKKTKRVLHVVNGEHFAGAERVQMHLGRCLPAFGFEADFACVVPGRFCEQFDLEQSRVLAFPMKNRFDIAVADRIRSELSDVDYHCIHAHTPRSAMVASRLAKKLRLPWVYHLHSPVARDSSKRLSNFVNSNVEKWSLASVDHLIAVSNSLKQQALIDGWLSRQVTVVHNGVPAMRPPRGSAPSVGGKWVIGMVALMRPRKGLEVALKALRKVRATGHSLVLRCIGPFETVDYEAGIKRMILELGVQDGVELVGFTKDIPAELAKLDAMVLPSLYGEGMPMVVLEAMAAGLPVVATKVEGTPEAIQHGRQGLLAEPNNPDSLADQIISLLDGQHNWTAMSESAVERHATHFSDVAMAQKTAEVYRNLAGGNTSTNAE